MLEFVSDIAQIAHDCFAHRLVEVVVVSVIGVGIVIGIIINAISDRELFDLLNYGSTRAVSVRMPCCASTHRV